VKAGCKSPTTGAQRVVRGGKAKEPPRLSNPYKSRAHPDSAALRKRATGSTKA
jgi:hypothetical protein